MDCLSSSRSRTEEANSNQSLSRSSNLKFSAKREIMIRSFVTPATCWTIESAISCTFVTRAAPRTGCMSEWYSAPSKVMARSYTSYLASAMGRRLTRRSNKHTLGDHSARIMLLRPPLGSMKRWRMPSPRTRWLSRRKSSRPWWSKYSTVVRNPSFVASSSPLPALSSASTGTFVTKQAAMPDGDGRLRNSLMMCSALTFAFVLRLIVPSTEVKYQRVGTLCLKMTVSGIRSDTEESLRMSLFQRRSKRRLATPSPSRPARANFTVTSSFPSAIFVRMSGDAAGLGQKA
mmetsp:Transcript_68793/g.177218  ORF Transcript_68793/g.177218 Transcript_68793/m.177218 type:complete len:289 (+) Transcript_68793:870-1736(+)